MELELELELELEMKMEMEVKMEMRDVMWWLIELIEYWNWRIVEEPVDRDGSVVSLQDSVHSVVDYR